MPKAFLMVRAVVAEHLRQKFDRWYATDHLPQDIRIFGAEKAWRFWSTAEAGVHYAVYQFADEAARRAGMREEVVEPLRAEFDRAWPSGVTRTRDVLVLAEEVDG